jgi:hypothetical protein
MRGIQQASVRMLHVKESYRDGKPTAIPHGLTGQVLFEQITVTTRIFES